MKTFAAKIWTVAAIIIQERARDILLNPRKHIVAEVLEIVDDDIFRDIRKQINAARAKAKFPAV
ncbi:MAG: hypothetical protein SR3Q1_09400 [Quinella sp. 3Q1]|nr:hypothetical protein [Quinella sp. 3Q1]MBR6889085.1 hypothetical protein [Selenomonadaceae bacterium]